jgi:hypothetical protein
MRHPPGRSKAPKFRTRDADGEGDRVRVKNNGRTAVVLYEIRARPKWYRIRYEDTRLTALRPDHLLEVIP